MTQREGSLEAPTRHPLDWKSASFYDEGALYKELERVYEICHGCRRCVNLCTAFPTLFDLIDQGKTMEIDGVDRQDYWKVVEQCYLCDMCYMTKCPYVPPHPWNVDFPHLMLRAKAVKFKQSGARLRDRLLSSTDALGKLATIPVVVQTVNSLNRNGAARALMEKTLGVAKERELPPYAARTFRPNAARAKGFKIRHLGEIIHAKFLSDYPAIVDKVKVTLITDAAEVQKRLAVARKIGWAVSHGAWRASSSAHSSARRSATKWCPPPRSASASRFASASVASPRATRSPTAGCHLRPCGVFISISVIEVTTSPFDS